MVVFALLAGLSLYLGMRLHAAITEISALRVNIASLKRRLEQQR
jgi:hypothetical protein